MRTNLCTVASPAQQSLIWEIKVTNNSSGVLLSSIDICKMISQFNLAEQTGQPALFRYGFTQSKQPGVKSLQLVPLLPNTWVWWKVQIGIMCMKCGLSQYPSSALTGNISAQYQSKQNWILLLQDWKLNRYPTNLTSLTAASIQSFSTPQCTSV